MLLGVDEQLLIGMSRFLRNAGYVHLPRFGYTLSQNRQVIVRKKIPGGITEQVVVRMRLGRCGFIQFVIGSAVIFSSVEFDVVGSVKNRIALSFYINGLFHTPVKKLKPARINRSNGKTNCL